MTKPITDDGDPVAAAALEVMSAMSALKMEPEPLEKPEGDYLSDRDYWVRHSMEHLCAAMKLLRRAQCEEAGLHIVGGVHKREER